MAAAHRHHPHDHDGHDHGHGHARPGSKRGLFWTLLLLCGYLVAEIVGGLMAGSLALLADAGHMFSDVAALGLSLFALWMAERPPTPQRTYGYYRTEILAALANGAALLAVSIFIIIEAARRFRQPPEVQGGMMLAIAAGGFVVNLAGLWFLGAHRGESLNIRGAWLHVMTDALGNLGTIVAGGLIWGLGWNLADPLTSILIAVLVIYSAWHLVAESVSVLMENAPLGVDVDQVRDRMSQSPGVRSVHDLHVWSITSGLNALSAHVVIEDGRGHAELLTEIRQVLHERFRIDHITIQIEPCDYDAGCDCTL
jgi:cobalt-zinc-cadmium efflux system protein